MDTIISLSWEMNMGVDQEDIDSTNPLSRSLDRLLRRGKPFRRFTMCFLAQSPSTDSNQDYVLRWFGIFILSHGNRIIFFPGLIKTPEHVKLFKGNRLEWDQEFEIDHITLEADWEHWHITAPHSSDHLGSLHTADLGDSKRLWFGMSFNDFEEFRQVHKRTSVTSVIPSSDTDRRLEIFNDAREGAQFQIIEPHPDISINDDPGIYHISVIVGPNGTEPYSGDDHGFPIGSPFLEERLPEGQMQVPLRIHQVSLSDEVKLQITLTKLPGKLNAPITFTVREDVS